MSYKLNPNATTTAPGNMSSADKIKLDATNTVDSEGNTVLNPAVSKTASFRIGGLPAAFTGSLSYDVGSLYLTQQTTATGQALIYIPLDRYPGASLASLKLYYQLQVNAGSVASKAKMGFYYRDINSASVTTVFTQTDLVYTVKGSMVSQTFSFGAQTLQAGRIYFVNIYGESGASAVAFDTFYSIEAPVTNITKIIT